MEQSWIVAIGELIIPTRGFRIEPVVRLKLLELLGSAGKLRNLENIESDFFFIFYFFYLNTSKFGQRSALSNSHSISDGDITEAW